MLTRALRHAATPVGVRETDRHVGGERRSPDGAIMDAASARSARSSARNGRASIAAVTHQLRFPLAARLDED